MSEIQNLGEMATRGARQDSENGIGVCMYVLFTHVWGFFLSVGKTSLLHQYVHKTFYEDYQTTLGASILSKIIILDDTTLKLQVSSPAFPSSACIPENHPTSPR